MTTDGGRTRPTIPRQCTKQTPAAAETVSDQSDQMSMAAPAARQRSRSTSRSSATSSPSRRSSASRVSQPCSQPEFDTFLKSLKPPQRVALAAGLTPELKEVVGALENPERLVAEELIAQRLTRDIYSNAQLQEVMTDFWLNHFNVYLRKNEADALLPCQLRARRHSSRCALGKFEDLLEATAHSPAMLLYLDNASSIGPDSLAAERAKMALRAAPTPSKRRHEGLNENYARELMELHTLGVNGGYTQADVTQVARILTGWTVDRPQRGGGFQFEPNRHEPGTKKVMGKKIKDHGETGRPRAAALARHAPRHGAVHLAQAGRSASSATIRRKASSIAWPSPTSPAVATFPRCSRRSFTRLSSGPRASIAPRSKRRSNSLSRPSRASNANIDNLRPSPTPSARWACRSTAASLPPATAGNPTPGSAPARSSTA